MPQYPYQEQGTAEYRPQQVPVRLSQIENQMTQIEKSFAEVMSIVDALQAKLQCVMREDGLRVESPQPKKEPEILVPLAGALQNNRRQIDKIGERLNGMLTHIEL